MKQRLVSASSFVRLFVSSVCLSALAVLAVGAAGGCLPDDPPVNGRLLAAGTKIESPRYMLHDGAIWVQYFVRHQRAGASHGGVVDVHLVKWDDGDQHKLVVEGLAERPEWPVAEDASRARFYMTDERLSSSGFAVGTLKRISFGEGWKESIPDIITYGLGASRQTFYYRKHIEGSPAPELHLRHLDGRDRNLGLLTGQVVLLGDDILYYVTGSMQTLTRAQGFDGPAVPLRTRVVGFRLAGERLAVATVADEGKPRSVVIDFEKKTERPLSVDNPCCVLDWRGPIYLFADSAKPDRPATLHYFNIDTGADRVVAMPPGLVDVVAMIPRPRVAEEYLIFDSQRNAAMYRPLQPDLPPEGQKPRVELLPFQPIGWSFTPDGKYFLNMVPEPPPPPPAVSTVPVGRLNVHLVDDWSAPPRQLSPRGASVPIEPRGYLTRDERPYPLVFWARYGLGASDLYVGDHEPAGKSYLVARGIGEITIGHTYVLGVMNLSQDLTGELVEREYSINDEGRVKVETETVLERGIANVSFCNRLDFECRHMVSFIVRERLSSSARNGLWAMNPRPPPAPPPMMFAPEDEGRGGDEQTLTSASAPRPW